ncbi:MAG TPA: GMC family oxidoreductase [Thermoanaerobaculia bacterium]|nr:GMC family oxidoreductase [Thermoanaerobaculia bacterium]
MSTTAERTYDYVIVGAGPGGGTLAARLAENGFTVMLLEAGGDPRTTRGAHPGAPPGTNTLPDDYDVPAFHAQASENSGNKWDFFVRHYGNDALQKKDPKYVAERDGVLYPRGSGLGGCTGHNAMITVYPHNEDWQFVENITQDKSWSPKSMRKYFERLENCRHRPLWKFWSKFGINPTRHGFKGWLHTEVSIPEVALDDKDLKSVIIDSAAAEIRNATSPLWERIRWFILGKGDPNDWRLVRDNSVGVRYMPLATKGRARMGARERVLDVMGTYPSRLHVELDALATRVLFDANNRAVGVEYLKGARLYRAHSDPNPQPGKTQKVFARREVVLCGGTYNTPQLLMLSGIGPRAELEKHGIEVRVDLPGVGSNLQDRYEISVVNRMNFKEWWCLKDAKFAPGDPQYEMWSKAREGVYTTNGVVSSVFLKSFPDRPLPDLFCFAIIGPFRGYYPSYSTEFPNKLNYLTWSVLKAHTMNTAGEVRLRSNSPLDPPLVNFRYFTEGNNAGGEDLQSVVEGVKFVRKLAAKLVSDGMIAAEELPGPTVQTDVQIAEFVRDNAWGHHASGTCAIGHRTQGGVVNGSFEVYGTRGLRVVDASVFPKIPGFFIAASVYIIGEKAADVITATARK